MKNLDLMYSEMEERIARLIPRASQGQVAMKKLSKRYYKNRKNKPINPSSVVGTAIRRINAKCKAAKRKSKIIHVGGVGPAGRSVYWGKA